MERLTEDSALEGRAWIKQCASDCPYDGEYCGTDECPVLSAVSNKLGEYERAEEDGLLVRLPCKEAYSQEGDKAYLIYNNSEIVECTHIGLTINMISGKPYIALATDERVSPYRRSDLNRSFSTTEWCDGTTEVEASEIGKTLFFDLWEAEMKLKEMEK
ncbi:hypothetical protein [Blautia sp. MSJ-19]|uniref:hypothetical protein n=1 Tax=Blautia sp. MSJ-19 TaxID=2841517 RepID=UPI001C0EB59D|nr:hypothetical protein [Blautia sp. MSJ-19]MBU5481866.1 hypothetical protein [Blautia sp. MSJ-19]